MIVSVGIDVYINLFPPHTLLPELHLIYRSSILLHYYALPILSLLYDRYTYMYSDHIKSDRRQLNG